MAEEAVPEVDDDGLLDVDFGDVEELTSPIGNISMARWDRARMDIDAREVIYMLHERRGNPISCPFHGRDSKPSFNYYRGSNTYFCFGCPDGDGFWDNIKIVARTLEITRSQALRWLEKEFELPPMLNEGPVLDLENFAGLEVSEEEELEVPQSLLNTTDLRAPFVSAAQRQVFSFRSTPDAVDVVKELFDTFWTALKHGDPVPLAKLVGADTVKLLIQRK